MVVHRFDVQVCAEPGAILELIFRPCPVLKLGMCLAEVLPPSFAPPDRIMRAVHPIKDQLMDDLRDAASSLHKVEFNLVWGGQSRERTERPFLLRVVGADSGFLAAILPLHIALQARASVAELEHQALRKLGEVDGVRVRHEVEGRVEQLLGRDGDGHLRVHQALRVHHWTCNSEDLDDVSLVVERLLQVQNEHQHQRVVRRASDHGVSEDGVGLVLGVRLVGDDETRLSSKLDDLREVFLFDRDHVGVDVESAIVPQKLQAQNIRFALPHFLLVVNLLVEHRELRHAVVAPKLKTPLRVLGQVLHTEGVDPEAGWLTWTDPNLVNHLGDFSIATEGGHVLLALVSPQLSIVLRNSTFASVPMVEFADWFDLELGVGFQDGVPIGVLLGQFSNGLDHGRGGFGPSVLKQRVARSMVQQGAAVPLVAILLCCLEENFLLLDLMSDLRQLLPQLLLLLP
mmetsp:Transcript_14850/g.32065  ORF Transcript_14850/g.32065 Transcript_14850/m.32065 type:complete len:457 (-) Transcript_14850:173-1543(-)